MSTCTCRWSRRFVLPPSFCITTQPLTQLVCDCASPPDARPPLRSVCGALSSRVSTEYARCIVKNTGKKECIIYTRASLARENLGKSITTLADPPRSKVRIFRATWKMPHTQCTCEIFTEPLYRIYRNMRKDRRRSIIEAVERETR